MILVIQIVYIDHGSPITLPLELDCGMPGNCFQWYCKLKSRVTEPQKTLIIPPATWLGRSDTSHINSPICKLSERLFFSLSNKCTLFHIEINCLDIVLLFLLKSYCPVHAQLFCLISYMFTKKKLKNKFIIYAIGSYFYKWNYRYPPLGKVMNVLYS